MNDETQTQITPAKKTSKRRELSPRRKLMVELDGISKDIEKRKAAIKKMTAELEKLEQDWKKKVQELSQV